MGPLLPTSRLPIDECVGSGDARADAVARSELKPALAFVHISSGDREKSLIRWLDVPRRR